MQKAYTRIQWENTPSTNTPLNETNLNKMDAALNTIDDRVIALDAGKADIEDIPTALSDLTTDSAHRVVTDSEKSTWNGKSSVNANPVSTTETLTGIEIDGVGYAVSGGGGSGTVQSVNHVNPDSNGNVQLSAGDVGALPSSTSIPSKTSDLTNDSGFITSSAVPTDLADLNDDTTHRVVTDTEKSAWNAKSTVSANPQTTSETLSGLTIDGVSYAVSGGTSPLIGTTLTLTPTQVKNAIEAGRPVAVTHTDTTYGTMVFTAFNVSTMGLTAAFEACVHISQTVSKKVLTILSGEFTNNTWEFHPPTSMATEDEIPSSEDFVATDDLRMSKFDVIEGSSSSNLLHVADADLTLDGLSVSIRNNVITVNGSASYSSGKSVYLKLTGTPELIKTSSIPASWKAEEIDFLEVGKSYGLQNFVLAGSTTATGVVAAVRNSSDTTILGPSKGVVTLTAKCAYGRLYLGSTGSGSVFTNYQIGVMICENVQPTEWENETETVVAYTDFYKKYINTFIPESTRYCGIDSSNYAQGMCSDDTYLYACATTGTDADNTHVKKISAVDGSTISETTSYSLGHCNSMTYCSADGYIHCVALDNVGTVHRITTSLEYVDSYTVSLSDIYPSYTGIGALYYNPTRQQFVGLLRGTRKGYVILDSDRNLVDIVWAKKLSGTYAAVYADENFIYQVTYNPNTIGVFAWNGKHLDTINFTSVFPTSWTSGEPEQMAVLGNYIFMSFTHYGSGVHQADMMRASISSQKYGMLLKL